MSRSWKHKKGSRPSGIIDRVCIDMVRPTSRQGAVKSKTFVTPANALRCPLWVKSGQTVPSQNPAMSALGHKRTFAVQNRMSALPPIADMCSATGYVRFVPKADMDRPPIARRYHRNVTPFTCGTRPTVYVSLLNTQDRRHHHEPERTFHLASELSQRSGHARNIPRDRARKGSPIFAENFQHVGP